jgi:hypothetical protein
MHQIMAYFSFTYIRKQQIVIKHFILICLRPRTTEQNCDTFEKIILVKSINKQKLKIQRLRYVNIKLFVLNFIYRTSKGAFDFS